MGMGCSLMFMSSAHSASPHMLQLRHERPQRELTNDQVSHQLYTQETLLQGLLGKLNRAILLVRTDIDQLSGCKQRLTKDLKDKVNGNFGMIHVTLAAIVWLAG